MTTNDTKTCPVCDNEFRVESYGLVPIVCEECQEKLPHFRLQQIKEAVVEARRDTIKQHNQVKPLGESPDPAYWIDTQYGSDSLQEGIMKGIHEELGSK